jgi:hypothetical protein
MWIKRVTMVIETSSYDRLSNSFGDLFSFTWVSISVTLGGVAAIPLLLMLLFRIVPLLSIAEMEEAANEPNEQVAEPALPDKASHARAAGAAGAVILLMVGLGAMGLGKAQPAYAESRPAVAMAAGQQPVVEVTAVADGVNNTLTATVTEGGKPVEGALVNFYESTSMFAPGDNQVPLGALETDDTGTAVVTYVAAVTGPRTISATYLPDIYGDPVTGKTSLDVTEAVSLYVPTPPRALAGVGRTLAFSLFGLVIIVLSILIAQVVRVRRVCRPVANTSTEQVLTA